MADLSFPWEMFMQSADRQNQNRQQMNQDIAGIGQGLGQTFGNIGQMVGEQKKKAILNQIIAAMRANGLPQQGPQIPTGPAIQGPEGYSPPNQGPNSTAIPAGQFPMPKNPVSGMGSPAQDNNPLIESLIMQYDPQQAIKNMPTKFQQSEIAKNYALANKYKNNPSGKPTSSEEIRKKYIEAINKRTEVMGQRNQFGQIDRLAKATGMQPQLLKNIQTNNVRADRAISILGSGVVYPQKLNLALVDLAGIMQGGAPQLAELHASSFPTWQQSLAKYKLYVTGDPKTPVPPEVVKEVMGL
jgi:hypothetical protein